MSLMSFGYEQDNGKIFYVLVHNLKIEDVEKYLIKRETPIKFNDSKVLYSIFDYFSKQKYNDEDTEWRILYMLDGTIRCKKNDSIGEFIYKSTTV